MTDRTPPPGTPTVMPGPAPTHKLLDVDAARRWIGPDPEHYIELCEVLVDERERIVADLHKARLQGPESAIRVLHELANSMSVVGAVSIAAALRANETTLRTPAGADTLDKAISFALASLECVMVEVDSTIQKFRGGGGAAEPELALRAAPCSLA
jgi:hypothetical protein